MDDMDKDFWDDAYRQDPGSVNVEDQFLDSEVKDLEPGTALDLGCGAGTNALKLARHGWLVTGVDWAEHAIELAAKAAVELQLDATFVVADITEWLPAHEFDLVISTYALPGGDKSRRVLQAAVAALAEGGTLIVAEWDRSMSEAWGFGEDELMTPDQIVALLAGLEIEKAEVRYLEDAFPSPDDPRGHKGSFARVAFVRARKPKLRVG